MSFNDGFSAFFRYAFFKKSALQPQLKKEQKPQEKSSLLFFLYAFLTHVKVTLCDNDIIQWKSW
jgi:hypothetical protein